MVLPTCPMAEFALPRHSAVMERLRRRIELCRRHHSTCEARYEAVSPERLELERQHTFALHQRCIQAKAKRAGKHRPPPAAPAPPPAAPARLDATDGPELGRPGAHLHDPVKRNLDNTTSPQNGDQQNGYGDLFAAAAVAAAAAAAAASASATGSAGHKKTRREAPPASPLGAPSDKAAGEAQGKLGALGTKGAEAGPQLNGGAGGAEPFPLHRDLKQEPVDDLPCMLAGAGGAGGAGAVGGSSMLQSNLMPDLNLNEQEWKELIEELNRSVPDEDMKDLFNDDFDDKKDPEPPPSAPPAPPPPDVHVKTEFESDHRGRGSPGFLGPDGTAPRSLFHAAPAELPTSGLLPPAAASSVQRALPGVGLPGPSQAASAELSSAHQLQQIAAKQKREQQLLQNPPPAGSGPGSLVGSWPSAHGAFGGAYPLDKAASPPGYSKADFGGSALLLGPGGNQASPRPPNASGAYLQAGHHPGGLLGHGSSSGTQSSGPTPGSVLDYGNTKPLSHYKADCGQGGQGKAALMASYLPQTLPALSTEQNPLFLLKAKAGTGSFRTLGPAGQEQTPPNVAAQAGSVGGSQVQAPAGGAHGSAPYLGGPQQAVVLKQHQMLLDQQKQREQQHFLQRQQQLLAEQEKQQFQRHLTRPPPQYQDPSQSAFPQQVGAFPGSSAAVPGMTSSPRVFSQPGNLMSLGPGLAPTISSLPAGSGPQERGVPQFSAGPPNLSQQPQPGGLYGLSPALAPPQAANGHAHMPRPGGSTGGGAYGQNSLGGAGLSQPPHAKGSLAKAPAPRVSASLGAQTPTWQHQGLPPTLSAQTPGNAGTGTPFTATAPTFHLPPQQAHLKISGPPFSQALPSRPLAPPGSAPQQRTSAPAPGAPQPGLPGLSPAGPELGGFSQSPGPTLGGRGGLACTQAYPVRTAGASTELPCPFAGDSDLIDSLLKSRTSEEWIRDLDDLLGPQ